MNKGRFAVTALLLALFAVVVLAVSPTKGDAANCNKTCSTVGSMMTCTTVCFENGKMYTCRETCTTYGNGQVSCSRSCY